MNARPCARCGNYPSNHYMSGHPYVALAEAVPLTSDPLATFSAFLDQTIRARLIGMTHGELVDELLLMHRTIKVVEEMGEVVGALIGLTGANPRKGVTHTRADLVAELHDVAVSVEGAVEHVQENSGEALDGLDAKIAYVHGRAGLISRDSGS